MATTLRILGTEATLENKQWTSDDPSVVRILTSACAVRPWHGYEANTELANAQYVAERFKGEIISHRPDGEPLPLGAVA
jgi:hypothetical protein